MSVKVDVAFTNALTARNSKEPYFLSDSGIEGGISVSDPLKNGFDLVKISFDGVLLNTIRYASLPVSQQQDARKLQVLLRMSDIKKRSDFRRTSLSGRMISKCTFRFEVPQCLGRNLLGEDSEYLSDLPASLETSEVPKDARSHQPASLGDSRICYTIRADVIRNETTVGTATKIIRILPSLKSRPPVCHSDFGDEYTLKSTKSMRGSGRLSLNKIGHFTVEAAEPEPVVLKRPNEPFSLSIPIKVSLHDQSTSTKSRTGKQFEQRSESAAEQQYECNTALVSSAYVSVVPRRGVPTKAEANRSINLTRNIEVCSRAKTTLTPLHESTRSIGPNGWETTMNAELRFDSFEKDAPLIPSFDSSMISFRYRIAMRIETGAPQRHSFLLDVPVTIRYSSHTDDEPPPFDHVQPAVDLHTGTVTPLSSISESLEERFASLEVQDLLQGHYGFDRNEPPRLDINLDLHEERPHTAGVDAPPYVM